MLAKGLLLLMLLPVALAADEITFTFVNLSNATFSASASGLAFSQAVNVLVSDNNTGKSVMLTALDSGNTGASTDFTVGPPLVVDYLGSGTNSALVATGTRTFLAGEMADSGRLEANYPDGAGAFLSRFHVSFVDPTILTELGTSTHWEPDGSVSLTLAETHFADGVLTATLGGGEFTITTTAPVSEPLTMLLMGSGGALLAFYQWRKIHA